MTSSEKWTPSGAPPGMLAQRFPVNSLQEITLNNGETISGRVYCTDELSGSIILQKALVHTTLASEIRIVSAGSVDKAFALTDESESSAVVPTPLSQPLPKIQKKVLEERERRAIRLAEERLIHINQKASSTGQAVFDRLLKACGEVIWKDETSILVLGQIQVDDPYQPDSCKIVASMKNKNGGLEDGSLDRVKKIVTAVAKDTGS